MKKNFPFLALILVFLYFGTFKIQAQGVIISDNGNVTPDESAVLELQSTSKGLLIPRMTTAQRTAVSNPKPGLLVFDSDLNSFFLFGKETWTDLSTPAEIWQTNAQNVFLSQTYSNVGIGTETPSGKFVIQADAAKSDTDPLFEIKDKNGNPVLIVTSEGVRVYVKDLGKGKSGGFAVGQYGTAKDTIKPYFVVTPDSTRVYAENILKGKSGGFAVGQYGTAKSEPNNVFFTAKDSTRIYTDETLKGKSGGFAVGQYGTAKGGRNNYMYMMPDNYFIGHQAGDSLQTGRHNGMYNTFLGFQSGIADTSGSNNIMIGYQSGFSNLSGSSNIFIGNEAGYNNWGGGENIMIGYQAGYAYTGQYGGICIGYQAGKNASSPNSTYIGRYAGVSAGASNNTFVGASCGSNASGGNNAFYGNLTGSGAGNTGGWNVFLGNNVGEDNTSGNHNLFAGWRAADANTTGSYNVFLGHYAGKTNQTGANNTYVGTLAGNSSTGSSNVFIGYSAGYAETGSNKLYIDNVNDATTPFINGDFANNRFALYRPAATYPLRVGTTTSNGNGAYLTAGGVWTGTSSRNFKDRFTSIESQDLLNKIEKMEIKGWFYKETQEYHIGPFAEDFYQAFGTGVLDAPAELGKYLAASDVAGVSLLGVQNLIKENNQLKVQISDLNKRLEKLEKLLSEK